MCSKSVSLAFTLRSGGRPDIADTACTPGSPRSRVVSCVVEVHALLGVVLRRGQNEPERRELRSVESHVHAREVHEAADEQPGADDERDGERDLADHERGSEPEPRFARGGPRARFAERLGGRGPRPGA